MKFFRKKRNVIITVIVLIILILILCGKKSNTLIVNTEKLEIGDINEYIRTDGTVEPFVDIEISSDIMGKCEKIFVKEGQKVTKNTPLLQIDNKTQKAKLKEAEASLKLAKSNYEYKKYLYENNKKLYEDSLISYTEYNLSLLDYKNADAQLSSAQAVLNIAKDNLNKTLLTSPINGVVSAIYVEEGENIITGTMNNPGTVLMTISDNNKMIVKSNVDETSIVKIKIGNKADLIFDAFLDTIYTGEVIQIANKPVRDVSGQLGTVYEVKILIEGNYKDLFSGMNADVSIITSYKENIKKVPIQAIVRRNNTEGVFIVKNNICKFVPVKTGIMGKNKIEIISDKLNEKDNIIIGPFNTLKKLRDKQKVKIVSKIQKIKNKKLRK